MPVVDKSHKDRWKKPVDMNGHFMQVIEYLIKLKLIEYFMNIVYPRINSL
jgi:hypothetical protein